MRSNISLKYLDISVWNTRTANLACF